MIWYHQVDREETLKKLSNTLPEQPLPFHIQIMETDQMQPPDLTVIDQWYVAQFVLVSPETNIQLSIGNNEAYEIAKAHLAPHFHKYREVVIEGTIRHMILGDLRAESKALFEQKWERRGISPIVSDAYRVKVENPDEHYKNRETTIYQVHQELLPPLNNSEADEL